MLEDPAQSVSPSTLVPQNYVQQLASALGLNSTMAASTDFESLIELNRRQQQQLNMSNVSEGETANN